MTKLSFTSPPTVRAENHLPPKGTAVLTQRKLASYVPDCGRYAGYEKSYKERESILYPVHY